MLLWARSKENYDFIQRCLAYESLRFVQLPGHNVNKTKKTTFTCQTCGYQTAKWMGKCPDCGEWQSFVEEVKATKSRPGVASGTTLTKAEPIAIDAIEADDENRLCTGIQEFDRVLGGGLVTGTMVLIGGDPGIGKSTLTLQMAMSVSQRGATTLLVAVKILSVFLGQLKSK